MLELETRTLVLDALRPPAGMRLDMAIGTTFTLDLTALLTVPLAAAMRDGQLRDDDSDDTHTEVLDLFETVRQLAERVVMFAQAGVTAVPRRYRPLLACLENSVIPVRRPRPGHLFHPKTWALRFTDEAVQTRLHRVVVLSRNLTFDQSWDLIVRVDEDPEADRIFDTSGVVDFLRGLPGLAVNPLSASSAAQLKDLAGTLRTARLALPRRATGGEFWPLGGKADRGWPFVDPCTDALAISPFLGRSSLGRFLSAATQWKGLVSRPEALDAAAHTLDGCQCLTLVPGSMPVAEPDAAAGSPVLSGLHAKLYVQDLPRSRSSLWIGSANLTDAAFNGNTEMLVRIDGPKSIFGVDALLGWDAAGTLSDILEDHEPVGGENDDDNDLDELAALAIDTAQVGCTTTVEPEPDGWWSLTVRLDAIPDAVELTARPLTLPVSDELRLEAGRARWGRLAVESISPFVVLGIHHGGARRDVLLRAELIGDPAHRRSAVLASCIRSPDDFLRFVLALLGDVDPLAATDEGHPLARLGARWFDGRRVLESLLLTASRDPARLRQLDALVTELERSEQGRALIPADFRSVWEPVWQVASKEGRRSRP